jgi:hypothetical protein
MVGEGEREIISIESRYVNYSPFEIKWAHPFGPSTNFLAKVT